MVSHLDVLAVLGYFDPSVIANADAEHRLGIANNAPVISVNGVWQVDQSAANWDEWQYQAGIAAGYTAIITEQVGDTADLDRWVVPLPS